MRRRRDGEYKKRKVEIKHFIGLRGSGPCEVFQDDPARVRLNSYPQYFFCYGPYETKNTALKDARKHGYLP